MTATQHVVMFSGGLSSWYCAKRVASWFGTTHMTLLFADTLIEDEDLYRFIVEAARNVGVPLTVLTEGRTPWQVFRDVKFLGNTRVDPCSRILKRELLDKHIKAHFDPRNTNIYVGIDWTEKHRFDRMAQRYLPWRYRAPLISKPFVTKEAIAMHARRCGIEPPRLYGYGFPHNNCGGFCIKAGQAHFRKLYEVFPERYRQHEQAEQHMRQQLGDVSILRDRRGGRVKPLTLKRFREEYIGTSAVDEEEWGGCGCFFENEEG